MLHKGKLQQALNIKRGQFSVYDGSFSEQLQSYREALESLYQEYQSSAEVEDQLPPPGLTQSAGARPTIEFDRWLIKAGLQSYTGPCLPFGNEFANHEQARSWAECIEGVTTVAVDGSQLQPSRDVSIPVALIQVGYFVNPHSRGRAYTKDVRMEVLSPDEIMDESRQDEADPDSYPYSEMQVNLHRYLLEVDTLRVQMEQCARSRREDDPVYSPVVFFDGSLVVSFAL
ncbi:MAG TPA: DNA double-strand break repair nuclease NurA, partial [Ktedonobacteraceae bacterium]|nr:DNA double-strand break repair nuclease NurA [Ktedonobacteraceae bacterium]